MKWLLQKEPQLASRDNGSAQFTIKIRQSGSEPAVEFPAQSPLFGLGESTFVSDCIEVSCEACGGTGIDPGGLSACERTDCETCSGSGKEQREYLTEAFRIVTGTETQIPVSREHLSAVIRHCRELVSAAMSLSEVA
jgi:hypothetical protein